MLGEADLQAAIGLQKESGGRKLGEILIENHFLTEDELLNVLSVQLGFPYLETDRLPRDKRLLAKVRPGLAGDSTAASRCGARTARCCWRWSIP